MGKSSKDKRDIYYRLAKEQGYRARSAFKLLHLAEEYSLFNDDTNITRAVDLCAAPGSWSQVLRNGLKEGSTIIAVDLQPMAPIEGVLTIEGDITRKETADRVIELTNGEHVDLVTCDGAPDVTGLHEMDEYLQSQLLLAALMITVRVLREDGTFLAKMFRGPSTLLVYNQMRCLFTDVSFCKPASSRASSYETFVVCRGFRRGIIDPDDLGNFMSGSLLPDKESAKLVKFIAHGDIRGFDSETTYEVPDGYEHRDPVQPPTAPPYRDDL